MTIMGLPHDVINLVKEWLTDRLFYVEANGETSSFHESGFGTIQGSVLGPVLFSIFIRPLYDLEDLLTYADDNYAGGANQSLEIATNLVGIRMNGIAKWMKMSGLKINIAKTELCVFHRRNLVQISIEMDGTEIKSMRTMNVLGILFDSTMKWNDHVNKAINDSSSSLYAIKLIRKFFSPEEVRNLLTSLYYSKLKRWLRNLALTRTSPESKKQDQTGISQCMQIMYLERKCQLAYTH